MVVWRELHKNDDTKRIRGIMQENSSDLILSLRGIHALKVKSAVSEVNDIICKMRVKNLDELKNLVRAAARLVCNKVGVIANKKEFKEPYWKRRIEDDIARLRKDLSQVEDWFKGRWKNIKHRRKMN